MKFFQTIAVAFSMYSAIPSPQFEWNEKNMRFAMCAFPLVGVVIGALVFIAGMICSFLNLPSILRGLCFFIIPIAVTGGIHIDGYCDTSDALASHASRERMLEIMKDSHVGSFAVIRLSCLLIAYFAFWAALPQMDIVPVWISFVLSRCLSGFAVATFPLAKNTGLVHAFSAAADKKKTALFLGILSAVLICVMAVYSFHGLVMAVAALAVFGIYYFMSKKKFGGITGDVAGWFLTVCEVSMAGALCISEYVEALL